MPDTRTDAELLSALAAADFGALRVLYDRHSAWLSVRLMRRCNDSEVVADALQDTFTSVWKDASRFRGEGDVAAWLWGIAIRRLISRLRSRKDVWLVPEFTHSEAVHPGADEQALLDVAYGDIGPAFARLSPEFRAVMQLTVLDGLTTKEAARVLRIPENTVKTRLHRAKAHLRQDLVGGRA